jgi:hypothetical protein
MEVAMSNYDREKGVSMSTVLLYAPFVYAFCAIWLPHDPREYLVSASWGLGIFMLLLLGKLWGRGRQSDLRSGVLVLGFIFFCFFQIQAYETWVHAVQALVFYLVVNWYVHFIVSAEVQSPTIPRTIVHLLATYTMFYHLRLLFGRDDDIFYFLVLSGVGVYIYTKRKSTA